MKLSPLFKADVNAWFLSHPKEDCSLKNGKAELMASYRRNHPASSTLPDAIIDSRVKNAVHDLKPGRKEQKKAYMDIWAPINGPANNKAYSLLNSGIRSAAVSAALVVKKEGLREQARNEGATITPTLTSSEVSVLALRLQEKIRFKVQKGQLFYVFVTREYRLEKESFAWTYGRGRKGSQLLSNLDGSPIGAKKLKELGWKVEKLHTCSNSTNVNNMEMANNVLLEYDYGSLWKENGKGGVTGEGEGFDFYIGVAYGDASDEMIINEKAANRHGIPIKKPKKRSSAEIDSSSSSAKKSKKEEEEEEAEDEDCDEGVVDMRERLDAAERVQCTLALHGHPIPLHEIENMFGKISYDEDVIIDFLLGYGA
jgi:hypothetical protein